MAARYAGSSAGELVVYMGPVGGVVAHTGPPVCASRAVTRPAFVVLKTRSRVPDGVTIPTATAGAPSATSGSCTLNSLLSDATLSRETIVSSGLFPLWRESRLNCGQSCFDAGGGGSPNILTRNTAISPRVTGFNGQ